MIRAYSRIARAYSRIARAYAQVEFWGNYFRLTALVLIAVDWIITCIGRAS
jgi:hypothetical protein